MKTCPWCNPIKRIKHEIPVVVSPGICPECLKAWNAQLEKLKQDVGKIENRGFLPIQPNS